jgi:hypothetical protein
LRDGTLRRQKQGTDKTAAKMKLLSILLTITLQLASAAFNDVYSYTLYANEDNDGKCREAAEELGKQVQETFDAAVPGFTPFESDEDLRKRFLRAMERDLQVRVCSRKFCRKRVNWAWCLWNGCSCSCGQRRELQFSDTASDNANVIQAKKKLDELLQQRSAELGCVLGLELEKVRG